jgi:hypothetical protein
VLTAFEAQEGEFVIALVAGRANPLHVGRGLTLDCRTQPSGRDVSEPHFIFGL